MISDTYIFTCLWRFEFIHDSRCVVVLVSGVVSLPRIRRRFWVQNTKQGRKWEDDTYFSCRIIISKQTKISNSKWKNVMLFMTKNSFINTFLFFSCPFWKSAKFFFLVSEKIRLGNFVFGLKFRDEYYDLTCCDFLNV